MLPHFPQHVRNQRRIEILEWILIGGLIVGVGLVVYSGQLQTGLGSALAAIVSAITSACPKQRDGVMAKLRAKPNHKVISYKPLARRKLRNLLEHLREYLLSSGFKGRTDRMGLVMRGRGS